MRTPLCSQIGIEFPIFAFSHCRDVVAEVTRAGGLGVLGAVNFTPEQLAVELGWIDQQVGDLPYGLDLIIPSSYVGAEVGERPRDTAKLRGQIPAGHIRFVDELLERHGVPPLAQDRAGTETKMDVSAKGAGDLLDVAFAHPKVKLIANALGPAPASLVKAAHERDVLVAGLVGTVKHVESQVRAGADIIVAQGYEAGGHTGEISTMVLTPQVVDAVAPLPVLAAGGIANGRQVAAAMALGAQGVWCGSVWLTTDEAETHPAIKAKILAASSSDTVRSRSSTGKPARQLRTAWTEAWDDPMNPDPLPMPLHWMLIRDAQIRLTKNAASNPGATELITYFTGQLVGQIDRVKPVKQVLLDMVEEFIDTLERMNESMSE
jgi:NAD(P)H-dependent flavin oxidoreductase YrpB (nitropropane dioxygenase family)